jgi:hypothetical protein
MSHDPPPPLLPEDAWPEDLIACTIGPDGKPEPPGPSMMDESVADRRDPGAADGPP